MLAGGVVLDLFSGQGGAARGYAEAGYDVIGVDNDPAMARRYPYRFECMDWRDGLAKYASTVTLIHTSFPCQHYSEAVTSANKARHPDLVWDVRRALLETGKPYVMENVPGCPLVNPVELCGCMFDLGCWHDGKWWQLLRPRLFEIHKLDVGRLAHEPGAHKYPRVLPVLGHGVPGWFYRKHGHGMPAEKIAEAMCVPWMTREGVRESIPPAFTRYIAQR